MRPWAVIHGSPVDLRDETVALVRQLKAANVVLSSVVDVDAAVDAGADIVLMFDPHPDVARCIAIIATRTDSDFIDLIGSLPDLAWMECAAAARDHVAQARRGLVHDLLDARLLATIAFLERAHKRGTAVVLGGLTEVTAALFVQGQWQAAHASAAPAQKVALEKLGISPMLASGSNDPAAAALGFTSILAALQM